MNIQEQVKNQQLKKRLEAKKEELVKRKLAAKQREKVNLDQSHLKTGKMEKTKIIQKKTYKTQFQKSRKIQHQIQDNANPGTYVGESQQYFKVLERTRNMIKFDPIRLQMGCNAMSAYAQAQRQKTVDVIITMENQIQCHQTPMILRLVKPQLRTKCIIIAKVGEQVEQRISTHIDTRVMTPSELSTKMRQDKPTKNKIYKRQIRLFSNFQIFSSSKMIKKLIQNQVPCFPIDTNKVPYLLSEQFKEYNDYLKFLMESAYFVARSSKQFTIRLRSRQFTQLAQNVESVVHQAVAKLIMKSKTKGNKLAQVKLKTETSIPIEVYPSEQ